MFIAGTTSISRAMLSTSMPSASSDVATSSCIPGCENTVVQRHTSSRLQSSSACAGYADRELGAVEREPHGLRIGVLRRDGELDRVADRHLIDVERRNPLEVSVLRAGGE